MRVVMDGRLCEDVVSSLESLTCTTPPRVNYTSEERQAVAVTVSIKQGVDSSIGGVPTSAAQLAGAVRCRDWQLRAEARCRGTRALVTIDQCRHSALQTF
jgi:hypothetical protein